LDATDAEYGGDYLVSEWVGKELLKKHDKPFFLACGIYRPHEPWFVPKKYFDAFPIEKIQLPPGYREDDLEDLPTEGKRLGPNRYFAHIRAHKQWRNAVQGYLASIYFADTMLGHVLDALDKGPNAKDTIVVLWSDHGWHLGEKQHWQKFTGWRACSRVPLIVRVPKGTSGLPKGTTPGTCSKPVSLLSLAPTLLELSGLPPLKNHDGPSLIPLLADPNSKWPHVAITHLDSPGSFGLSTENWRYIHYAKGGEELYNMESDPYEWRNLANQKTHQSTLERLRALAPRKFAKLVQPKVDTLPALKWKPLAVGEKAPLSKPDGNPFDVVFINRSARKVELFWMDRTGGHKPYALIVPGAQYAQQTRPGAVWMIAEAEGKTGRSLGYFEVGDRAARAVVPK
jgi:arylsulfatase A-like enzyme